VSLKRPLWATVIDVLGVAYFRKITSLPASSRLEAADDCWLEISRVNQRFL